jgi:hypothetical protein
MPAQQEPSTIIDLTAQDQADIDLAGKLREEIRAEESTTSQKQSQLKAIDQRLLNRIEAYPADEEAHLDGMLFRWLAGKKRNEREITDRDKLKRKLSARHLWNTAWNVTWKVIDSAFPDRQDQAGFMREERTGRRDIDTILLPGGTQPGGTE